MRIVLIKDVYAAHLGFDAGMGLLYGKGSILDDCLPGIEQKLLAGSFAVPEEEWLKQQQQAQEQAQEEVKAKPAPDNKRGKGARENKARS